MVAKAKQVSKPAGRELVISRVFDAPRELVWRAWTEPEHFKKWWGPKHFTCPVSTIDLRVGGSYLWCMRSPQGQDFYNTGVYREIVPMSRLVYTQSFADALGNAVAASHYGLPGDWPPEVLVTVTFEADGARTRVTWREAGIPAAMSDMAEAGCKQSLDKLAESLEASLIVTLPSDREIVMTRVFDAPRRLVFEAHTKPEHVKRWWGPRRLTMVVCEMDFRPGGAWRFVHRGPDGQEYGFRGVYREIVAPERIVQTFEFDGMPGHGSLETLTLVEKHGKTTLTARSVFQSVEDRDGMLKSGMEAGARETMDRLAELLETLKADA